MSLAQNDFHKRRHTGSFLQSFKWFQDILLSYYISPPNTKLPNQALAQETVGEILKTCKNEFNWLEMSFS